MAKNKGTFQFAANFQVKVSEALDPRLVAASKADLINKDNWPSDGDTIYVYKGLIVDCGDDGVYRLINPELALATDYSGWQRIDSGGVQVDNIFTYKGSIESYDLLPSEGANIGDVYNIEEAFTITETTPLGDIITKEYPAGTNVAWNGKVWQSLAGSIDLSVYATKLEVSELRTTVNNNAESVKELSTQLGVTNLELSNKVDMVEGSSLISQEKLLLIDSNASQILTLSQTVENTNSRVDLLEQVVHNDLKVSVNNMKNQLSILSTDNNNNKTKIDSLLSTTNNQNNRLLILESDSNQKAEQIAVLQERINNTDNNVSTLTTRVDDNTQAILELKLASNTLQPGDGLKVEDNVLKIKIDPSENNKLIITENGLMVDTAEFSNIVDEQINEALKWDEVNN